MLLFELPPLPVGGGSGDGAFLRRAASARPLEEALALELLDPRLGPVLGHVVLVVLVAQEAHELPVALGLGGGVVVPAPWPGPRTCRTGCPRRTGGPRTSRRARPWRRCGRTRPWRRRPSCCSPPRRRGRRAPRPHRSSTRCRRPGRPCRRRPRSPPSGRGWAGSRRATCPTRARTAPAPRPCATWGRRPRRTGRRGRRPTRRGGGRGGASWFSRGG